MLLLSAPVAPQGYAGQVRQLLLAKADTNLVDQQGATALYLAAEQGHLEVAKLLLVEGSADANLATNTGVTALIIAAYEGHRDIVRCLLRSTADPTAVDNSGYSAVHAAVKHGHRSIARALIRHMNAHSIPLPKGGWDLANLQDWVPQESRESLRLRTCVQCGNVPDLSLGMCQFGECPWCPTVSYW